MPTSPLLITPPMNPVFHGNTLARSQFWTWCLFLLSPSLAYAAALDDSSSSSSSSSKESTSSSSSSDSLYPTMSMSLSSPSATSVTSSASAQVSVLLLPAPSNTDPSLLNNPRAIAGLVIGLIVAVLFMLAWTWFTWKRIRIRQLEAALSSEKVNRSICSGGDHPRRKTVFDNGGNGPSDRISRSVANHESADLRSTIAHGGSWFITSGLGDTLEDHTPYSPYVSDESGYLQAGPSSSIGHGCLSSLGHSTSHASSHDHLISSRTRSPPSSWPAVMNPASSARQGPIVVVVDSRVPSRNPSRDSVAGILLKSDSDSDRGLPSASSYSHTYQGTTRDYPEPHVSTFIPHTVVLPPSPAVLNPPSSLLRPPSNDISNTLSQMPPLNSDVFLRLPYPNNRFMSDQDSSPAISEINVSWGREGLLNSSGSAAMSLSSLRDEVDYSRPIGGIVNNERSSMSTAGESFTEHEDFDPR